MNRPTLLASCMAVASACACTPATPQEPAEDLVPFAHAELEKSIEHPLFVDFGSKMKLVGYDVSPEGEAKPGATIHLTLYWKRSGHLDTGWQLFTHLEDDYGRQIANFDKAGAFREAVNSKPSGLARLELEKIYTDEQTLTLPKAEVLTPKITLVVGVWNDTMRLPIVSGSTDGNDAAIITHFATGVPRRPRALLEANR